MTAPDGTIPGGAVNYDSLAAFAAKTEEDWRAEMEGSANQTWGEPGLLGALFQNLGRGKPLVQSLMESLADAIGLGEVWDNVTHVSQGIGDFINSIFGVADSAASNAESALAQSGQLRTVGAWHADRSDDVVFAFGLVDGFTAPPAGKAAVLPLTIHKDRPVEAVKFLVEGALTMTNCYVAVYTVDRATGLATRWLDLGDCKSHLTNPQELKVVPLPQPVTMAKEELAYIWIGQTGTPNKLGSWSSTSNPNTGLIPRTIGLQADGTTAPATLADNQIQTGTTKFWGSVGSLTELGGGGTTPPVTKYDYWELFDRADSDSLGASWMPRAANGSIAVKNRKGYGRTFAGLPWVRWLANSYTSRLGTTEQQVQWTVPVQDAGASTLTPLTAVLLRGDGSSRAVMATAHAEYEVRMFVKYTVFEIGIWQTADFGETKVQRFKVTKNDWPGNVPSVVFRITATGNSYVLEAQQPGTGAWYSQNWEWVDLNNLYPITSSCTEVGVGAQGQASLDFWNAKDLQ